MSNIFPIINKPKDKFYSKTYPIKSLLKNQSKTFPTKLIVNAFENKIKEYDCDAIIFGATTDVDKRMDFYNLVFKNACIIYQLLQ